MYKRQAQVSGQRRSVLDGEKGRCLISGPCPLHVRIGAAGGLSLIHISSIVLITVAMPAPSVTTILAETYNGNRGLAAKIVFLTSLFCMITLPLVAMFLL